MIRTIHHLSATGGTLISKTIAALNKAVLVSEVGPLIGAPKFHPFDPVVQYLRQVPERQKIYIDALFVERVRLCQQMAKEDGKQLVLRDYAHGDFLGKRINHQPTLVTLLDRELGQERCSVVTIRHPVDSWLSLVKYNWHRNTTGFDDYCRRSIAFLDAYTRVPVFRYEDFVADPVAVLSEICTALQLTYGAEWQDGWPSIRLTGDSGRKSETISLRPRREMDEGLAREVMASTAFSELTERCCFRQDFVQEAVEMADTLLAVDPGNDPARKSRDCYSRLLAVLG